MPYLLRDTVLQDVLSNLVTASDIEPQQHLWPNNANSSEWIDAYTEPPNRQKFRVYSSSFGLNPEGFFVSALRNGTNTGVLREHALRLNSSVSCRSIPRSKIPDPCPGARPFETHIKRAGLELKVCAPGYSNEFPFTPSRHRQDITEELYIDLEIDAEMPFHSRSDNFTTHCTSSTSRGYFELGNAWNDNVYGPLLDKWPGPKEMEKNFHDYRVNASYAMVHPTAEDAPTDEGRLDNQANTITPFHYPGPYQNESTCVPGPLMVSAQVLFGNYSLLRFLSDNTTKATPAQAYSGICEQGSIPFAGVSHLDIYGIGGMRSHCQNVAGKVHDILAYHDDDNNGDRVWGLDIDFELTRIVASHVKLFNATEAAEYALMISQHFANKAVLVKTMIGEMPFNMQNVYYSPGGTNLRTEIATASLVVLTILIALQTCGLFIVIWFIYSVPTWADSLEATEVARIGNPLPSNSLPPLGPVSAEDEKRIRNIDGLIGLKENRPETDPSENEDHIGENSESENQLPRVASQESDKAGQVKLAIGGKGVITCQITRYVT